MEQQVQLLQDTLDYEKENGVLWTKVYEIMDQGNAFMLDFLSGAGALRTKENVRRVGIQDWLIQ